MSEYRLAFAVRNEFQYGQFKNLADTYQEAKIILLQKKDIWSDFLASLPKSRRQNFEVATYDSFGSMDGRFDAIFFQTPFPGLDEIRSSRLISVQYGLAKERHNYGEWRSLADMNLMYGEYSARAVTHFSPSYAVGNLRFAGWDFEEARRLRRQYCAELGIDAEKPTILFMPTYDELGSLEELIEPLAHFKGRYNIVVKGHHNQKWLRDAQWTSVARELGHVHLAGGSSDALRLLAVADVVLSDFSGAIFDAVYACVPVVLYHEKADRVEGVQKFSRGSVEYQRRHELGVVCESLSNLSEAIDFAVKNSAEIVQRAAEIRAELMVDGRKADIVGAARAKVQELFEGKIPPLTTAQTYVRELYQSQMRSDRRIRQLRSPLWTLASSMRLPGFTRRTS